MLFFCLVDLFLAELIFETLSFALLILLYSPLLFCTPSFLFSLIFPLIHSDLMQTLPFCFFIEFHRHNYCVIAGDGGSVAVDVSSPLLLTLCHLLV